MYKIHNNLSPSYLRRIFTNTSNVHSHNLGNSELNYYVPRPRTESGESAPDLREIIFVTDVVRLFWWKEKLLFKSVFLKQFREFHFLKSLDFFVRLLKYAKKVRLRKR